MLGMCSRGMSHLFLGIGFAMQPSLESEIRLAAQMQGTELLPCQLRPKDNQGTNKTYSTVPLWRTAWSMSWVR